MKLVLADAHVLALHAIERVFELEPDFNVVARCLDGAEALRAIRTHKPDVLVVDLHLPDLETFEVLRDISNDRSLMRVILLTAHLDEDEVLEAFRLGVRGFVLKDMEPRMLVQCVRKVHAGGYWLELQSIVRALDKIIRCEEAARWMRDGLTSREIEIVAMVVAHLRNKEIGDKLHISEGTVKSHLHNIYRKLHLGGRCALASAAREANPGSRLADRAT